MSENELITYIGVELRKLRTAKGLTLVQLEAETGISNSMISDIERGNRAPSIHTLNTLLTFFQIRWSKFFEKA